MFMVPSPDTFFAQNSKLKRSPTRAAIWLAGWNKLSGRFTSCCMVAPAIKGMDPTLLLTALTWITRADLPSVLFSYVTFNDKDASCPRSVKN